MFTVICYVRPITCGELVKLLKSGAQCEVVSSNANVTYFMLVGWLGFGDELKVRPYENKGWSIFEV